MFIWNHLRIAVLLSGLVCVWGAPLVAVESQVPFEKGLAARYPRDEGIGTDPEVIVTTGFESDAWRHDFSGGIRPTVSVVADDPERDFQPLCGNALRIKVPQGEHYGASIEYDFKKKLGYEPEEI